MVAVPFLKHPTIGNKTGACPLQKSGFPCQRYSVPEASLIEVSSPPRDFKVTDTFSLRKIVSVSYTHLDVYKRQVWTRQMESDDKTVEGQREKIDHTCTDRRLHWSTDRYDSISS